MAHHKLLRSLYDRHRSYRHRRIQQSDNRYDSFRFGLCGQQFADPLDPDGHQCFGYGDGRPKGWKQRVSFTVSNAESMLAVLNMTSAYPTGYEDPSADPATSHYGPASCCMWPATATPVMPQPASTQPTPILPYPADPRGWLHTPNYAQYTAKRTCSVFTTTATGTKACACTACFTQIAIVAAPDTVKAVAYILATPTPTL